MRHFSAGFLTRLAGPLLGLACVAFLWPRGAAGFVLAGGSLDLDQRDFRVFDNFADATANDNTTADPQFPGYTGAALAIWKGCVEWGSELHGDGSGDPTQPFDLGSGGANFDASFQGLAPGVGNENGNVHSALDGMNGTVLAFTETGFGGIDDGWRIRYYEFWGWDDGPGTTVTGLDLQGIACHEYGHALGLGHSLDGLATMAGGTAGSGIGSRSIEPDDVAGVQAIYGARDPSKPSIDSLARCGDVLSIVGSGFADAGNEVWFTRVGPSPDGEPVRATDVPSSAGGTRLEVSLPALAGSGDVLVRRPGAAGSDLSNAWPFDATAPGICEVTSFCLAGPSACASCPCANDPAPGAVSGCVNSTGSGATLVATGSTSLALDDLGFVLERAVPATFALLEASPGVLPQGGPCAPGSGVAGAFDGLDCLAAPVARMGVVPTDAGGTGAPFGPGLGTAVGATVGSIRRFQARFRESAVAACGTGAGTSQGVEVLFVP